MPNVLYDQRSGVTAEALEAARRRERERAQPAAYGPSMSGLTEPEMESSISRAQIAHDDVDDAVDSVRANAQFQLRRPMTDTQPAESPGPMQLRAPMTGAPAAMAPQAPRVGAIPSQPMPAPMSQPKAVAPRAQAVVDPRDQMDRDQAERLRRQRIGLAIAGAVSGAVGDPRTNQQRMTAIGGALQSIDPSAPLANIDARAQQRREDEEAARQASIEDEQRALESEYRHTLMRSMDVNSDRREFEMTRRGEADERLYDPASPTANARRSFLQRLIATNETAQAAFGGLDLSGMGARDLQQLADQVARRISADPARRRGADMDALQAIVSGLDEQPQVAAPVAEAPVEAPPTTDRERAVRIARARQARQAGAPAPVAPTPAPEAPPAPSGLVDRRGNPPPWAGRDRTVAQQIAETIIAREPQARSWPEALAAAQAMERSRTREVGALAGGVDTRSREAQFQQTQQTGTFTEADVQRTARLMAPMERQSRALRNLIHRVGTLDEASFRQALQGGNLSSLGFNAADFAAQWAAYSNPELRERSGAAVTQQEYERFLSEFSAGRLNSPQQFQAALQRVLSSLQAFSRSQGFRRDVVDEVRRRGGSR